MDEIIERFKAAYHDCTSLDVGGFDKLYAENVRFRDPVHELSGLSQLQLYLEELCNNLDECRFEYLEQVQSEGIAYVKWNMHFRHPSLGKRPITVRGVSQIHYDSHIFYQEDIYDMGAMIYEHVPLLGLCTRWLKNRLGG
jgi:hypothetical protein